MRSPASAEETLAAGRGREIDERVTHKKHALSLHVICCSTTEELKEKIATGCRWFRVRG